MAYSRLQLAREAIESAAVLEALTEAASGGPRLASSHLAKFSTLELVGGWIL